MAVNQPAPKPRNPKLIATMGGIGFATLFLGGLAQWEGKRNIGYTDIAGYPTACFGDTNDVEVGKFYSDAECARRLEEQALKHVAPIKQCIPGIRGYQLIAFGSLAYNIGVTATCNSSAARHYRAGNVKAACDGLLAWNKARINGKLQPVRGLTNRRQWEREICLRGL